jgi:hypothetical protein
MSGIHSTHLYFLVIFEMSRDGKRFMIYIKGKSKMEKTYKQCQSCGMPLKKDEKGGGTNADGTKSNMYCSHCYENGKFTQPDITVSQMKERVKTKLKESGFPGFITWIFIIGIPKLERWKKSNV